MTERKAYYRKISYLVAIVVLMVPIFLLSMPARGRLSENNQNAKQGGLLTQMRVKYRLSHKSLGNVDPASETVRLASLGFRGVAATILWQKAHEYKKKEDWYN
ncbi:MAG: hypothetical protein N2C14_10050, partial [Planctomycetales bacterium]